MVARLAWFGIALALALAGCGVPSTFACEQDEQCRLGGVIGRCPIGGYCAFADGSCASGWRYHESAGDLAGVCVGDEPIADARPSDASIDAPPGSMMMVFGPSVTIDTYISQDTDGGDQRPNNFGGDDTIKIKMGEEHGLIEFDISAIPGGATIFSASLTVYVSDPGASPMIEVRPLREEWIEGTLQGTAGRCNWTERDDVPNPWATAGAAPPGSADPVAATFQPTAIGPIMVNLPAAMVQPWLTPAQNHGMLLLATQDNIDLVASESSQSSQRPSLTVVYVP